MSTVRVYAAAAREALGMAEDVAALGMVELRGEIKTRLRYVLALAAAMILIVIALVFAGIALLVLSWDSPYRIHTAIGLVLIPLVTAGSIAGVVIQRWRTEIWLPATRSESRELYAWLKKTL